MSDVNIDNLLDQIKAALEQNDLATAIQMLESLRAPDQADVFNELDDEDKIALLPALSPSTSADILEDLSEEEAAELVSALPLNKAMRIVEEMEPDEVADLLGDIQADQARSILAGLENPEEVRPLLMHPDESAGGLMTSEFLALRHRSDPPVEAARRNLQPPLRHRCRETPFGSRQHLSAYRRRP
jgi:magnesium transporter